jgi:anti-sigma regulatory factor (Ser/Thr protein kinase)
MTEEPREAEEASTAFGSGELPARGGDEIIGATLHGLRQAAEEVKEIAGIAETLQRSLLSAELPEIPGLRLAARYEAGSYPAQVGGDWYDVIPLRDGRAGIVIGDVVGHGIDAAAQMAHLKSGVRAYALEGLRPSLVLERTNGFVRQLEDRSVATLLYGIVDPGEGQMRLASAGHPPPLIVSRSGTATYAEGASSTPLGAMPFPRYEDSLVTLAPGSLILLYTDGLVERPGSSLDAGLEWLRKFAERLAPEPELLCAALVDACFRSAPPRDDVALLGVGIDPVADGALELTLPAEPESLARMRRSLARWLRGTGATEAEAYEILVACGEACSNAVAHAYPPGDASYLVEARRAGNEIELRVRDFGSWREPRADSQGRGLKLIADLVDRVEIERAENGTVVTMWRRVGPEGDR